MRSLKTILCVVFFSAVLCGPVAAVAQLPSVGKTFLPGQAATQDDTCSATADTCSSPAAQPQPPVLVKPTWNRTVKISAGTKAVPAAAAQPYRPEILAAAPEKESHVRALPLFLLVLVFLGIRIWRYNR